jgi:NAD(P)-dependent dehydrogenase (short-subunit alcohol dehydrogenase family)
VVLNEAPAVGNEVRTPSAGRCLPEANYMSRLRIPSERRGADLEATPQEALGDARGGSLRTGGGHDGQPVRGGRQGGGAHATKHAVVGFVQSLALDYGDRGVRLNAVAPAFTLTAMTEGVGRDEAALAPFLDRIALGRPGVPEDVAPAVLFLASDDAAYVTGSVLTVDGGTSASTGQPR